MREGEELKASRHASAAATRDDHLSYSEQRYQGIYFLIFGGVLT